MSTFKHSVLGLAECCDIASSNEDHEIITTSKDCNDQYRLISGGGRQGIGARKILYDDHRHPIPLERRVTRDAD